MRDVHGPGIDHGRHTWLLSRPGVAAPVLGPRTPDPLDLPLPAPDTALSAATPAEPDRTLPPAGTGGPGPEAWAW